MVYSSSMFRKSLKREASHVTLLVLMVAVSSQLCSGQLNYGADDEIILSRLDLARLSQLRLETRGMDLVSQCSTFDSELRDMLGEPVTVLSHPQLMSKVIGILSSRQLPFGNNQPVLERLEACYQSDSLDAHSGNQFRRQVIASPPYHDPIRDRSSRHIDGALDEFRGVRRNVRDYGQDIYGANPHHVTNEAKRAIHNGLENIEDKLEDIVEDAADGRLDGIKNGRPYSLGPAGLPHHMSNDPNYVAQDAKRAIRSGLDRIEDKLEDIVEDAADGQLDGYKGGLHRGMGYHPGAYRPGMVDPHASQEAKRAIRSGLDKIEDRLEDIVEDAADGRLDGIKNGIGYHNYGPGYPSADAHHATLDAKRAIRTGLGQIEDKLEDIVEDAADGRLDGIKGGYSHGSRLPGYRAGMGALHDPREAALDAHYAAQDTKRVINRGLNKIEDKLEDLVEDMADGRIDGHKGSVPLPGRGLYNPYARGYHHDPRHVDHRQLHHHYPAGGLSPHPEEIAHEARREINHGLNKIQDKLEDIAEDAADGRLDGYKDAIPGRYPGMAGYSAHPGYGGLHPADAQYAAHDAKRVINHGLNNIQDKLEDIVEDAADGRLDGIKEGRLPHGVYPSSGGLYGAGGLPGVHPDELAHAANHAINNGLNRIEDKLEDLVEDMEDGRIDGIKGHGLEERHRVERLARELAEERIANRRLNSLLTEKQYEVDTMRHKLSEVSRDINHLEHSGREDRARYEKMKGEFEYLSRRENELARSLELAKSELHEKDRLLAAGSSHPMSVRHSAYGGQRNLNYAVDDDDDDDVEDEDERFGGRNNPVAQLKRLEDKMSSKEDLGTRCQRYFHFFKEMPSDRHRVKVLAKMPMYRAHRIALTLGEQAQVRRFAQVLSRSHKKSAQRISRDLSLCSQEFVPMAPGYPMGAGLSRLRQGSSLPGSPLMGQHIEEPPSVNEMHSIKPDGSRVTTVNKSHAKLQSLKSMPPTRPGFSSFHGGMNRARMSMPSMPTIPPLAF